MDHPILHGIGPVPALRSDVPAHLAVAPDLHTGAPFSIAGKQVQGIRECGKVVLFTVQMPRPGQFNALLNGSFCLFCRVPALGGTVTLPLYLRRAFCMVRFCIGFLRALFGFRLFAARCQTQAEAC